MLVLCSACRRNNAALLRDSPRAEKELQHTGARQLWEPASGPVSVSTGQTRISPALRSVNKLQLKQLRIGGEISPASWPKCKSKLENKLRIVSITWLFTTNETLYK